MALIEFGSDKKTKTKVNYRSENTNRWIGQCEIICKWPQPVTVIAGHWKQHQSNNFCFFLSVELSTKYREAHIPKPLMKTIALILLLMKWSARSSCWRIAKCAKKKSGEDGKTHQCLPSYSVSTFNSKKTQTALMLHDFFFFDGSCSGEKLLLLQVGDMKSKLYSMDD